MREKGKELLLVATLPMYDLPELHAANDAFWMGVSERLRAWGIDAPKVLTRGADLDTIWLDAGLLLAQTCGYPLVTTLKDKVSLLATPEYSAPGCEGPLYRSAIVVRAADGSAGLSSLRGRRCAVNGAASNSGMNVLRAAVAKLANGGRFFSEVVWTGSHAGGVDAVAEERADVAAIDCVTWAHLQSFRPAVTDRLRVLEWTAATPGLPLITSCHTDAATRDALLHALEDVVQELASTVLLITGFARLPMAAYETIRTLEQEAASRSYPCLR